VYGAPVLRAAERDVPAPGAAPAASTPRPLPQLERVMPVPPREIGGVALLDTAGRPVDATLLRGAPTFVLFGFTHCPDVCPGTLTKLRVALRGDERDLHAVRVVMITADPERDTPEALGRYLAFFGRDFVGLTGDERAVRAAAAQFKAAFYRGAPRADGGYVVDHSFQVFAVDAAGRLRAELYDASAASIATLARALLAEAR
jgi:protein SCO1/2